MHRGGGLQEVVILSAHDIHNELGFSTKRIGQQGKVHPQLFLWDTLELASRGEGESTRLRLGIA